MVDVRRPATGVARAWDDARALYVGLDARVFLPPDPDGNGLGRWMIDHLTAEAAPS